MDVLRLLTGGTNRRAPPSKSPDTAVATQSSKKSKVHSNFDVAPLPDFSLDSPLPTPFRKSMITLGYSCPTEIQRHLIPALLSCHDVVATAETGSGKTFAFLLPLFSLVAATKEGAKERKVNASMTVSPRAIILAPTRELAQQITAEAVRFQAVCSRKVSVTFLDANKKAGDVVVATPLKLLQSLNSGDMVLEELGLFVMDEGDKLLDLGFLPQVDGILGFYKAEKVRRREAGDATTKTMQLCLVSATLPEKIVSLATACMEDPVKITIGHVQAANKNIEQTLVFVGSEDGKIPMLRAMAREGRLKPPTIVFVDSKERAVELMNELLFDGLMVDAIHGDRSKYERDRTVQAFREGKIWILIATDVLGRGIDFSEVEQVVNFDVPKTAATYIHRIGRTGRAGRRGHAVTLFTEDDVQVMRPVVNVMRESQVSVPEWLVKAIPKKDKRKAAHGEYQGGKKRRTIGSDVREKVTVHLGPAEEQE
jgi:ATP-dependent RNA helicase DDX52/ROK1